MGWGQAPTQFMLRTYAFCTFSNQRSTPRCIILSFKDLRTVLYTMARSGSLMSRGEVGNTKTSPRIASSKYWLFTLNNHSKDEFEELCKEICPVCLDYRVQEEIGEEGTLHLQGYIQSKTRIRPLETFTNKRIHWEKARSPKHARAYCCKDESATGQYVLDKLPILRLILPDRPWQLDILNILSKDADDRTIHWYWEPYGNSGKSAFTKYLCAKKDALCVSGKSNDCKYAIVSYLEEKKKYPSIVIFDIPRTNIEYLNYEAVESIKNGCFFSGKYESCQIIMNSPHLIIFANSPPMLHKLSEDRWHIIKIEQGQLDQRSDSSMSIEL